MTQQATVSAHDCVGSNLYAHVLRGTVKRIVPRENESINETWIADRDRYSYEAIYSDDRLLQPQVKEAGQWRTIEWEDALNRVAETLQRAPADKVGILASPSATAEEAHLLARISDHLGTSNIDHRIGRRDFSDQDNDPLFPWLGCEISDIENQGAIVVAGSNVRHEAPILAHRIRKAALAGAQVSFVNGEEHEYLFDVATSLHGSGLVEMLAGVAVAAAGKSLPESVADICSGVTAGDGHKQIADSLKKQEEGLLLLGNIACRHRAYAAVRALAAAIAESTGATLGFVSEGANSAGACLAGVLPHRTQGGAAREAAGLDAGKMLDEPLDVLVMVNVEPDADIRATENAARKVGDQGFTVALTPFISDGLLEAADILLPVGTWAESSGTFVNAAGTWQSFPGIASPVGESRPTWKVLRVIGNLVDAPGFDHVTSEDVRDELVAALGAVKPDNSYSGTTLIAKPNGQDEPSGDIDTPIYAVDPMVRRATALQLTTAACKQREEGDAS
jgi:NADH-quinone oxidoreductase subunit G